jgi:hypothetical protein
MRYAEIAESFTDWNRNDWVHFTDTPYLKLNPKPFHQDPIALYFFPASYEAWPSWQQKAYKITAKLDPSTRVLDLAHVTEAEIARIVDAAGIRDEYADYTKRYPPKDTRKAMDMAWEQLQRKYMVGRKAAFNKLFRSLGYDAIFDDTGSIHNNEVQLIVLDPRKVKVVSVERQKLNAFAQLTKVQEMVAALGGKFGTVETEPVRRRKLAFSMNKTLNTSVRISNPEQPDNYARLEIGISNEQKHVIHVSISYSRPSLGYGSGASLDMATGKWQFDGLASLERDLAKIFTPHLPR